MAKSKKTIKMAKHTKSNQTVQKKDVQGITETLGSILENAKSSEPVKPSQPVASLSKLVQTLLIDSKIGFNPLSFGKVKVSIDDGEFVYIINGVKSRGNFEQLCKAVENYFQTIL